MRRLRVTVLLLIIGVGAACASGSSTRTSSGSSSQVITRAELDAAGSTNLHDLVTRLRPHFLRDRGSTTLMNQGAQVRAVVFLIDTEHGPLETLRSFAASTIEEVRYYPGPEATTRFGSQYGLGIIRVRTRVR